MSLVHGASTQDRHKASSHHPLFHLSLHTGKTYPCRLHLTPSIALSAHLLTASTINFRVAILPAVAYSKCGGTRLVSINFPLESSLPFLYRAHFVVAHW